MKTKTAVMLLAHGTREPEASEPVHHYAEALYARTGMKVVPCLREFIEPSIPTVVEQLVKDGVEEILVVPFFLFNSGHVTRDIAEDLEIQKQRFPHLKFRVGKHLGFDEKLVDLLQKRLEEI